MPKKKAKSAKPLTLDGFKKYMEKKQKEFSKDLETKADECGVQVDIHVAVNIKTNSNISSERN